MRCLQREVVMSSIDNNELFEKYYQTEYDFNTTSLSLDEIDVIKKLAREKRVDYAFAPMGIGVFDLIQKQSSDIRFELVSFESDKIDGMLYIPTTGKERAYIILNSNKPLVNQVFAAALKVVVLPEIFFLSAASKTVFLFEIFSIVSEFIFLSETFFLSLFLLFFPKNDILLSVICFSSLSLWKTGIYQRVKNTTLHKKFNIYLPVFSTLQYLQMSIL